jgi:hypothetical protein
MADKNREFLAASVKMMQARRWDVIAAQIADKITVLVRVPPALLNRSQSAAEQALSVSQDMAPQGWAFAGFSFDGQSLNVDLVRDKLE